MRFISLATLVVLWCVAALGQQPTPGLIAAQPGSLGLPVYPLVMQEHMQKQIELVPEQKQKLEAIGKKYTEESRASWRQQDWSKFHELSEDERRAKYKEIQDSYAKGVEDVKRQVEAVLLPHQIEKLKQVETRQRAASMLYMPNVVDRIGLSDEQKQKLKDLREEQQKRMQQLQQEMRDKAMEVLTAEQLRQIEELGAQGWQGLPRQ